MVLSKDSQVKLTRKIMESRLRVLCNHGFYGTLLMHMNFALDNNVKNVCASNKKITFNPEFLNKLNNDELDLVMMHEITHISLRHNTKRKKYSNKEAYDKATDIIVNSNLFKSFNMNERQITLLNEILEHQYRLKEGHEYSLDELYQVIAATETNTVSDNIDPQTEDFEDYKKRKMQENNFDDHNNWNEEDELEDVEWQAHNMDACEMMYVRDPSNSRGTMPLYAQRAFMELKEPKVDWRTLLDNFIQEEVNDYSFTPPDKRYSDSDFFLPDYNEKDEKIKNVLFMIDTSGSMSDAQITTAYSEVKGVIDQYGGKLEGLLGFFDAAIVEPVPFTSEDEFSIIKPYGGGGTDFSIIFKYVRDKMKDIDISSIVILTDGYAPFPLEEVTNDIPTIWLINNDVVTPPWGKIARLQNEETNKYS